MGKANRSVAAKKLGKKMELTTVTKKVPHHGILRATELFCMHLFSVFALDQNKSSWSFGTLVSACLWVSY